VDNDSLRRKQEVNDIVNEYAKKKGDERNQIDVIARKEAKQKFYRNATVVIGATVFLILFARIIIMLCFETALFGRPHAWAAADDKIAYYNVKECVANLWQVRAHIDSFYVQFRRAPRSLEELYDVGLSKEIVCPVSGRIYEMKNINGEKVFACPTPEDHGAGKLYCTLRSLPPTISQEH